MSWLTDFELLIKQTPDACDKPAAYLEGIGKMLAHIMDDNFPQCFRCAIRVGHSFPIAGDCKPVCVECLDELRKRLA